MPDAREELNEKEGAAGCEAGAPERQDAATPAGAASLSHAAGSDPVPARASGGRATASSDGRDRASSAGSGSGQTMNFRQRVALCFAATALATALLFVVVLTLVWNNQFSTYARDAMDEIAASAASSLASVYDSRGYWTTADLASAAAATSGVDDVGIQIIDANGIVRYDSTLSNASARSTALEADISLAPTDDSQEVVTKSIVAESGQVVGTVRVWVYGSDILLTQRDESFRASSFQAIAFAGVAAVILSACTGLFISRLLTQPIRTISHAAQRIKEGDLSARSNVRGSDDLGQLGETFDSMAESVERDRELERRLTTDVAHELRTPLMSILATVEAMQDEVLPCDQTNLALVSSETKRLSRLVDGMLRLSRLESGSVHLKMKPVDAVQFVGTIARSHAALLEDAGLTMTFTNNTGADEFIVELDRDTVTQAVTNIISNAMRYTPAPGEVEISIARAGDEALISVRDTGIGIAKEDIGNVFGRFWRAEESRNRVAGGLGVGLAVTKEILERHHGHIEVESEQGVGTTFTLHFPITQPTHEG